MQIACKQCDSPFESTNIAGKYIFCPWCGKRQLNPRFSRDGIIKTTSKQELMEAPSASTTLFDNMNEKNKLLDIFGRPISPDKLMPRKRSKIRLFIKPDD